MTDDDTLLSPIATQHERLWTPWRMRYIGGDQTEPGCIFCNRLQATDDRASLILHRGRRAFVIMNLFPYNTGHVMIVPNEHAPSPESLDIETITDMAHLAPRTLKALRGALNPAGFNLGTNVGAVAGAGIAAHLHQHVVPRWQGDANFMPILAGTMVLPELIPVTYAKIRAEFARDSADNVVILAVDAKNAALLIDTTGDQARLPRHHLTGEPVWRTAASFLDQIGAPGSLAGWAGASSTTDDGIPALAFDIEPGMAPGEGYAWRDVGTVLNNLTETDGALLAGAIQL